MGKVTDDQIRNWLKVYFIMGSNNCLGDPLSVVREALEGGVSLFQFREKGTGALLGEKKIELAKSIQALCRNYDVPFIINDDIQLALDLDADGVHIGQEDESAASVREKIGDKLLGVSVHTLEEANRAIAEGADYFGIGPIFTTSTKEDAKEAAGTALIELLRSEGITVPIVGIGGITAENASVVMEAGADGASVITAISQAESPFEAARQLAAAVNLKKK
ncbi:thiamine phosphate synthase [Neobacillus sp. PS3-34]|uniref:thiamine phosphate synthase n=1 Tax=Neobacillus sp. PS3-34 TaxID=3070678 RepID=UPI0027E1C449|nr:thiamine phosphate synthase [Neobacillus sp. PS3-34]WML47129.1 thiamine phosphate synthase [Neobacillus sp. PS3-34]